MARQKFFPKGDLRPMYGKIADYVKMEKAEKPQEFLTMCKKCGYIREKKRWYWDPEVKESMRKEHGETLCPGCEAIENEWIEGDVTLKHKVLQVVPWDIEEMLENIEETERHIDPKNRIVKIKKSKTMWKVYTASVFLAERIGKELEKSYNGKTHFKWSKGDRSLSVIWE